MADDIKDEECSVDVKDEEEVRPEAVKAEEKPAAPASEGRAKRERKQVEHFKPEMKEKEAHVIKEGSGVKLADIPNVRFKMTKLKPDSDVVVELHRVVYQRPGVATKRKRDVLEFSGFVWEDAGKERAKASDRVKKLKVTSLTAMLDLFELPKDGNKEDKVARIVSFLEEPKDLGKKDLATLEEKKKAKKKRAAERKAKAPAKKKPAGKKKAAAKKEEGSDDDDDDDDEDDASEEEEEEEEEEPAPKKAKATPKKATPKKKAASPKNDQEDEAGGDDADELPPLPSDDQLKDAIKDIVEEVDLQQFSFKALMSKLTGRFPRVAEKRAFVKDYVTQLIAGPSDAGSAEGAVPDAAPAAADDAAAVAAAPAPAVAQAEPAPEPTAAAEHTNPDDAAAEATPMDTEPQPAEPVAAADA